MHERKYKIKDNQLVKRDTEVPVPPEEPLFILRAKDRNALPTLVAYSMICDNLEHRQEVQKSVADFKEYLRLYPENMSEPD